MNTIKMNQQGIEATLAGVKTMIRRPISLPTITHTISGKEVDIKLVGTRPTFDGYLIAMFEVEHQGSIISFTRKSKYKIGEVLEIVSWDEYGYHGRWHKECEVKITGIKVEFLQDISEEDCIINGLERNSNQYVFAYEYEVVS